MYMARVVPLTKAFGGTQLRTMICNSGPGNPLCASIAQAGVMMSISVGLFQPRVEAQLPFNAPVYCRRISDGPFGGGRDHHKIQVRPWSMTVPRNSKGELGHR